MELIRETIINEIITKVTALITEQWVNVDISFYNWVEQSSDYEFYYVYESTFKKYFELKPETGILLSYYSQNLCYSLLSFCEFGKTYYEIDTFIKKFITHQFKNITLEELYLN